ncbi:class A beta-lactamase-related serine hydrolase [Streptomyces palmae]|uniref:Class A beta-lactamase-related serine hydrolase n=1 Tax=Streptomyces palmae TaxID=1701085 RepID=A0A4Z0HBL8_9ACTN|nr:class A beta-lactamase-related serine hydrolase [Streptomyces palmae]
MLVQATGCTGGGGSPRSAERPSHSFRPPSAGPADLRTELRRALAEGPAPGAAVLVRAGGRTRFTAAGVSDVWTGRPVQQADHFRAGSLTKTFLATVVLQLCAEGRLGPADRVERYLPGLLRGPGLDGRKVTVRQLLAHTSGLYDYTRDPALARELSGDGFAEHRFDTRTPRELLRTALAHRPTFSPPGSGWRYSNTDYLVLGLLVEKVTGHDYATEVRRRIIEPLRLTGTSFPGTRDTLPAPHGRGYSAPTTPGGPPRDTTTLNPSIAGAAGSLVSTLDDLARFTLALLDGELLPQPWLAAMRDTRGTDGRYGLGLFPVALPCGTVWGHNGVINGSSVLVVGTLSGHRVLAYRVNHDAGMRSAPTRALLRAEFCA